MVWWTEEGTDPGASRIVTHGTESRSLRRRFDPIKTKRDALARSAEALVTMRSEFRETAGLGQPLRMRHVLRLDALRERHTAIASFEVEDLELLPGVDAANLIERISELDPESANFREDLFCLRQRLAAIRAGESMDERLVNMGARAVRMLEDAIRRSVNARGEMLGMAVLDEAAELFEDQRVHALLAVQTAIGRLGLIGLDKPQAEQVLILFRRIDPTSFGFDPGNSRFTKHIGEIISHAGSFGESLSKAA